MNKSKAFLMTLLMTATAMVALAPTAQAAPVNNVDAENGCISGDWLLVCATIGQADRSVIQPDESKLVEACTDPIGTGDICVYTVPSIVNAVVNYETVTLYTVDYHYQVYTQTIVDFACTVLTGTEECLKFNVQRPLYADMDDDGVLDAIAVGDVLVPFTI